MPIAFLDHATFNRWEANLWFVFAAGFLIAALVNRRRRRLALPVALSLVVFGISDLIEVRTGAWWRPWWLLVMKAGCITVFAPCLYRWLRTLGSKKGAAASRR